MAVGLQNIQHTVPAGEFQPEQIIYTFNDLHDNIALKLQTAAGSRRFARPHVCQYLMPACDTFNQHFYLATGGLVAPQACRNYARIIKYQQVARVQQTGEIRKLTIHKLIGIRYNTQQTAGTALLAGMRCNLRLGKLVIEVCSQHAAGC